MYISIENTKKQQSTELQASRHPTYFKFKLTNENKLYQTNIKLSI